MGEKNPRVTGWSLSSHRKALLPSSLVLLEQRSQEQKRMPDIGKLRHQSTREAEEGFRFSSWDIGEHLKSSHQGALLNPDVLTYDVRNPETAHALSEPGCEDFQHQLHGDASSTVAVLMVSAREEGNFSIRFEAQLCHLLGDLGMVLQPLCASLFLWPG